MESNAGASTPFRHRELNGELLLDELASLRAAAVTQAELNALAAGCQNWAKLDVAAAAKVLMQQRATASVALSQFLETWAKKLKHPPDVALLAQHFQRLAMTSACISALRRAAATSRGAR
jgi:hypothetical protein